MWIAEAVPPVGPLFVPALAALFAICACIVAIGIVKLVDAFSRSLFGTLSGAVGWLPFAGKVVKHSLHKIEQKISHGLGSAEKKLDGYVALSWHTMAELYRFLANEISGGAVTTWHLAQQARAFVRQRDMNHAIRRSTAPLKAQQSTLRRDQHNVASETKALSKSVAQGVYPRLKTVEHATTQTIPRAVANARAEAKAAEAQAIATYKWLVKHRLSVLTGVFTGAVAFALARLGGGWIRCANWRRIGKTVCGLPRSRIDALLGLLLGALALANIRTLARFAEAIEHDAARGVADLVGVATRADGQFTIE